MFLRHCDFQVFLEPFSRVLGQAKSKQVLITEAQSHPRHMNCLHQLGINLGITDWVKDYQKKLNPPQGQKCNMLTAPVEQAKVRIHVRKNRETVLRLDWMIFETDTSAILLLKCTYIVLNIQC